MARTAGDKLYDKSDKIENMREAKKGDVKKYDFESEDGPGPKTKFKGEYESIGIEGRKDGDPDKIDPKDMEGVDQEIERWKAGGKKETAPVIKDVPKDEDRKGDGENYEIWKPKKKREIPTS